MNSDQGARRGRDTTQGPCANPGRLVAEGKLTDAGQGGLLVFTEDVPFSTAAAVVYGGNQNGRVAWRADLPAVAGAEARWCPRGEPGPGGAALALSCWR